MAQAQTYAMPSVPSMRLSTRSSLAMRGVTYSPLNYRPTRIEAAGWRSRFHYPRPYTPTTDCHLLFPPPLRWELSPYSCIPLPHVEGTFDAQCSKDTPRRDFANMCDRDVQPRVPPRPRMQPIALPALKPEVSAVILHPELRSGVGPPGVVKIDFGSWVLPSNKYWLTAPATFPGLPSLTVLSPCFPWPITVHALGPCVVVQEVFDAIHASLDIHLTDEQLDEWMTPHDFHTRKNRKRKKTHLCGVTRLSLLGGRTRFGGLSESGMGCDIWELHLI
ncbi:hypothetical protein K438DRAFT_1784294 [Mycena galopus ATCC 62051]|nr:hypothetical protein K438DRAFT_1784294 [Mycena galopus ATCC 62051]